MRRQRDLFARLALSGLWWAYPLLWLVPLLTWMMVISRIRNIAEHAVVPDGNDPLRNTRTTRPASERLFVAPYYVNYHLEHHLLFYVPCYNLPRVHLILMRGAHASDGSAAELCRGAAARDGESARRRPAGRTRQSRGDARAGAYVDKNQAASRMFECGHRGDRDKAFAQPNYIDEINHLLCLTDRGVATDCKPVGL